MTPGLALRAAVLALATGASAATTTAVPPPEGPPVLPLEVIDVVSGAPAKLEPGARLLHVVIFATWCPPCEEELPLLAEWEARFGGSGYRVAVVAVARRQSRDRLLDFAVHDKPPGHLYLDAAGKVERVLAADGVPTHVLIDGEGRVRLRAGSLAEIDLAVVEGLLVERGKAPEGSR